MISATNDFITAIAEDSRTFTARILKNNVAVDCDIRSIKIQKSAFGDTSFSVGAVTSSQFEIVADGIAELLENEDIEIRIGVRTGDDGHILNEDGDYILTSEDAMLMADSLSYITVGFFTVVKIRESTYETTITGTGYIASKMGTVFTPPEEQTLDNIAGAITEATGVPVTIEDDIDGTGIVTAGLVGLTCRDALDVLASVTGGFATENSAGGIEIHKYQISEEPLAVTADRVTSPPELAEADFEMTGIAVQGKGTSFSYGYPIRQTYSNEYMTTELFTAFARNIVGLAFRPGEVPMALGDPRIEPWDTLLVEDLNGRTFNVPCHQITINYDGGLTTEIEAVGETESEIEVRTPLMKRIDAIEDNAEELADLIADLEAQIDGKIETWAQETDPSINWSDSEKEAHNGDLWLYTGTSDLTVGELTLHPQGVYQYDYPNLVWIAYASTSDNLFDLADGKATVFYGSYPFEAITDMQANDIAIDSTTKKIYRYDGSDWVEVDNYTVALADLREILEAQIDEKIETWYQSTDPFAGQPTADLEAHDGDLWFYTGATTADLTQNATYRYDHAEETGTTHTTTAWVECQVSESVFDEIDGKTTVWYGSPSGTYDADIGDYLVDPADGSSYRWNGSTWVVVSDYMTPITSQIVLETTYSVLGDVASFAAFVYVAGVPVTHNYADSLFKWYRKTEDYTNYPSGKIPLGTGKSIMVNLKDMNYGGVVRCEFNYQVAATLLNSDGWNLVTSNGERIIAIA